MPDIDVTDLLVDPDFCEQITVRRLTQSISVNGRVVNGETDITIIAVVEAGSVRPMERTPATEISKDTITVHSQTILHGPTNGNQPDIVVWRGSNYVVSKVYDWSHFGKGFTAAECNIQDTVNAT
jgi:galactose-6-phosphate isomerase